MKSNLRQPKHAHRWERLSWGLAEQIDGEITKCQYGEMFEWRKLSPGFLADGDLNEWEWQV